METLNDKIGRGQKSKLISQSVHASVVALFVLCFTLVLVTFYGWAVEMIGAIAYVSVWSHVSLADFLVANGLEIVELRPRFLPPVWPLLIQAYLASPLNHSVSRC